MLGCSISPDTREHYSQIGITEIDFTIKSGKRMHAYIWYPTFDPSSQKDFITSEVMQEEISRQFGMPKFSISTKETTDATVDAKIVDIAQSSPKLPVVFFSHGFASFARQNNRLMEHYAKNGLIVVALSNPKDTLVTEYTNGDFTKVDQSTPAMQMLNTMTKAQSKALGVEMFGDFDAVKQSKDDTQYTIALKQLGNNSLFSLYSPYVQSGSQNLVQSVQLMQNSSSPIFSRMDFSKLALVGHSLGGLIAIDANRVLEKNNQQAKVVVSLDSPAVFFDFQNTSLDNFYHAPHCAFQGGFTKIAKQDIGTTNMSQRSIQSSQYGGCTIDTPLAHHNNYSDLTNIGMLKYFGLLGKVNGGDFGKWMNETSLVVIQHYLYNTDAESLDLQSSRLAYGENSSIEQFRAK